MANKRKTYGVRGLMEWVCSIACGKAVLNVSFTGGTLTGYGVTPATYVTEDPMKQAIIENSSYFKNGRIKLLREEPGTGKYKERERERRAEAGTHQGGQAATASAALNSVLNPDGTGKGTTAQNQGCGCDERGLIDGHNTEDGAEGNGDTEDGTEGNGNIEDGTEGSGNTEESSNADSDKKEGLREVEVTDIDDARDWLNEHLGVARRNMRSRAVVLQAAENGGVVLKGI